MNIFLKLLYPEITGLKGEIDSSDLSKKLSRISPIGA
jgi:hypothetical protein